MPTQHLPQAGRLLFHGDSITAAGRQPGDDDASLGLGYVRLIADALRTTHPGLRIANRAVSGFRVRDLRARWAEDVLADAPDVLSVMVGVNDTWRRYDSGDPTTVADYTADYRHLLETAAAAGTRLVLIEPFLVPAVDGQWAWREDLDGRIHAVRRLAEEYDALLLAADGLLNQAARTAGGAAKVAADGVHPEPYGHALMARAWLDLVCPDRPDAAVPGDALR
jgi:lysophospholipase L1-like esterase